ncbi:hypothetical protein BCR36DRAFT_409820 [Piromyces finnis]|uniref:G-protein coupled receptors family 3 profile domain-containing protein n=1 Tax=Piromyces finnis TaxID=1754191 RepID=A0A1Y1VIX4_9FUNG|nr:hypothetical protein BCR36DRAFT_409820 [Piromyces finnis]|eukprot:ORX56628.1 hypothetical protein BCR36DRAFT_409820 [Piromyces finnis]
MSATHFLIYLLSFFILFIVEINCIIINTSNGFIENINKKEKIFQIQEELFIDNINVIDIKSSSFSLSGKSIKSVLSFINSITFSENCENIEIKDITINGDLYFHNNKKIIFQNVIYNGVFISNNENLNKIPSIEIHNSELHLSNRSNGFEINNYHVNINNSNFYGNNKYNLYLLKSNGIKDHFTTININNSYFNGNYFNSGIQSSYTNITCFNTKFEKLFNTKILNGGAALSLSYTNCLLNSTEFNNNYSESYGGSIYLKYTYNTTINNIDFKNTTGFLAGHAIAIYSDNEYTTTTTITNANQIGNPIRNKFNTEGTFLYSYGENTLRIDEYNGVDLNTGSVMSFEGDPNVELKKFEINRIYMKSEGSVIRNFNPKKRGAIVNLNTSHFNDIVQDYDSYSAILFSTSAGKMIITSSKFENINGYRSGLTYQENRGVMHLSHVDIINVYSKWPEPLFFNNNQDQDDSANPCMEFTEFNIYNVFQDGVIFHSAGAVMTVSNAYFYRIHECYKFNNCNSFKEPLDEKYEAAIINFNDPSTRIMFSSLTFDEVYGKTGIILKSGMLIISGISVQNSYFENGFINISKRYTPDGQYMIGFMYFLNNLSYRGTFLHIEEINTNIVPGLDLSGIEFTNNRASNYGGVFYSNAKGSSKINSISFNGCSFKNNTALLGNIVYAFDNIHKPNLDGSISMYEQAMINNVVTNPTHLKFDNYNQKNTIEIYSGDNINSEYLVSLYDDFGNKFQIDSYNNLKIENLIFYELSIYGDSNAKILGSHSNYCMNNTCSFKNLQVVGNPGDYSLELKLVTFGQFEKFENNNIAMNIKIKECDKEGYINSYRNGINIKSCYIPQCNTCNLGKCINDNLCNCANTKFTGLTCSERYKQKRPIIIDIIISLIAYLLISITIIVTMFAFFFKNEEIVKAASFDFLILILIGLLLNYVYVLVLVKEKYSNLDCFLSFVLNNCGFSFVFGSIITKTYRIYYIFSIDKKMDIRVNNIIKYSFVLGLLLFHSLMTLIQILTSKFTSIIAIDADEKEYNTCQNSDIKILSLLLNIFIIIAGAYYAYGIRNLNQKFKEPLSVPIYAYIIYILLLYIMKIVDNNKLVYYFDSIGTLIYSSIVIYYLYVVKLKKLYYKYNQKDGYSAFFKSYRSIVMASENKFDIYISRDC